MNYLDAVRAAAVHYLGREVTDDEWNYALGKAKKKLDRIISREGDLDGERRKPYYLGKLVQERIFEDSVSAYTAALCASGAAAV